MMTQNETSQDFPDTHQCKNCGKHCADEYKYCPYCSQKQIDELTLYELFNNFISNYLSVDGRFLKSIGPLLFKPGFLAQQYVLGKRETYLHPGRMYLFVSIVFFFVFSFFIRDSKLQIQLPNEEFVSPIESDTSLPSDEERDTFTQTESIGLIKNTAEVDSLLAAGADEDEILRTMEMDKDAGLFTRKAYKQLLKLYKEGGTSEVHQRFFDSIPLAMFFLLPVFALILFIFHFRRSPYTHHLVFSYYYFSFVFVILGILYSVYRWFDGLPTLFDWLMGLAPIIYLAFGMRRFYGQSWKRTIFKEWGILLIFMVIFVPITAGLVALYAFLYF